MSAAFFLSASAQWSENGIPVCTEAGGQRSPVIIPVQSGIIVVWEDGRGSNTDIYMQKYDLEGSVAWSVEGVAACRATNDQWTPTLVSDLEGGAIVAWADWRGNNFDIYAQRVSDEGVSLWPADGIAVCGSTMDQTTPCIVEDGAGGSIICWVDFRYNNFDIFAQRVGADGQLLWESNGIVVCSDTGRQDHIDAASDREGGILVSWEDRRNGQRDIFAQRIDKNGIDLWGSDGVAVCVSSGNQYAPEVISDNSCGAIIAWVDQRSGHSDLFVQRVDTTGNMLWSDNGIAVCSNGFGLDSPNMISDGEGGAILAWEDSRYGENFIYAQRILSDGSFLWETNGVEVCSVASKQWSPKIVSDGEGGAIISWYDYRNGNYDIFAQRVDAAGNPMWTGNGEVICSAENTQWIHSAATDGEGGAMIIWEDSRKGSDVDLYLQRIDADGSTLVATLLQSYSLVASGREIELSWTLSEIDDDARFIVERSSGGTGIFTVLSSSEVLRQAMTFTFIDRECVPGTVYRYNILYTSGDDRKILLQTEEIELPEAQIMLMQNYPNPFNPSTMIGYYLPGQSSVSIIVYDVQGRLIKKLVDSPQGAGMHKVKWDGTNTGGGKVSSGVYFYRLDGGKVSITRKMILVR